MKKFVTITIGVILGAAAVFALLTIPTVSRCGEWTVDEDV